MRLSDFHYLLPSERIAQEPLADRSAARMLHLLRDGRYEDRTFRELPEILQPDDLMVFNNTKVFPARLFGSRSGRRSQPISPQNPAARDFLHGQVEVLLVRQVSNDPNEWDCLVRPGKKIGIGERLFMGEGRELEAEVVGRGEFGERRIRFDSIDDFFGTLERVGHVPLPPYIHRDDAAADRDRYQTVYARERGSVAAPTAGLHFTAEILDRIRLRGAEIAEITLHVGLGTFQPVHAERVEDHKLHGERYEIIQPVADAINCAVKQKRRVVAVGTTTVRTLEYASRNGGTVEPGRGEADLFIYPGYKFQVVSALLTNFHLPESTLLMLVCAFGGYEHVMNAYRHAVESGYRFYSYGDCMFVE
ncbi:MAG TPA: tRNA preQ1(34) S-adenosylmethionine ribosyltransferase-isomerase QueA [Terriglobales bacterium]|nr:tRNA preQ1(34) S-adenosylmethionine ribosyltransferase-isomerase QueA [Terriglobales bacterium]